MSSSRKQRRTGKHRLMTFEVGGQTYHFARLGERQHAALSGSSIHINEGLDLEWSLYRMGTPDPARTYVACRQLFGRRGRCFDPLEGAFAFPFAVEVPRGARRPAYLFTVRNFRSRVEYLWHKVVDPADERLATTFVYPPDTDEFSREEIRLVTFYFLGLLEGFLKTFVPHRHDRFVLAVESNLTLFGYNGEKYFKRRFDALDMFKATHAALSRRLPTPGFYDNPEPVRWRDRDEAAE